MYFHFPSHSSHSFISRVLLFFLMYMKILCMFIYTPNFFFFFEKCERTMLNDWYSFEKLLQSFSCLCCWCYCSYCISRLMKNENFLSLSLTLSFRVVVYRGALPTIKKNWNEWKRRKIWVDMARPILLIFTMKQTTHKKVFIFVFILLLLLTEKISSSWFHSNEIGDFNSVEKHTMREWERVKI